MTKDRSSTNEFKVHVLYNATHLQPAHTQTYKLLIMMLSIGSAIFLPLRTVLARTGPCCLGLLAQIHISITVVSNN